jgi:branched-chain amino acid transport system permease protein
MGECLSAVADQFWVQTRNGLSLGAIYAMIALGYTMVYGVLQLINFAHSEVFMVGTVATFYSVTAVFGVTEAEGPPGGLVLVTLLAVTILLAMLASGALAVTLERFAYRPLRRRGAPRLSFLISAIGASLFIQYLFNLMDGAHYLLFWRLPNVLGPSPRAVPTMMSTEEVFSLFGASFTNKRVLVILVAVVMLIVLDTFVRQTRVGRGIRAVAQDSEAASIMGVNIDRVVVTTFLVGGIMAGAAGMLYLLVLGIPTAWNIGFLPGIKAFTAAVLGGIGNIRGAMLGGLVLGMVEGYATACVGSEWTSVVAFVVLVAVLMLRPTGILGEQVGA